MKTKYLIETSCVPVSLNETSVSHRAHFEEKTGKGEFWSSLYIRKEFIRRWIRGYIAAANAVVQFGTLDEALAWLEEDFSIRNVKVGIHTIRGLLTEKGQVPNDLAAAKEIGRMAVRKLKDFDRRFSKRIQNTCGCKTGGKRLAVDYNALHETLRSFVEAMEYAGVCPVNDFLDAENPKGRAQTLLSDDAAKNTKSVVQLEKLVSAKRTVNCTRCSKIGDAIIALECPKSWGLVSIDNDFQALCVTLGKTLIGVKSSRACQREMLENATEATE